MSHEKGLDRAQMLCYSPFQHVIVQDSVTFCDNVIFYNNVTFVHKFMKFYDNIFYDNI